MTTKILYIEDEEANRKLVKQILEYEGYLYVEAEDGLSGIKMVEDERPDLILMDINMPDLDGYAVTTKIKGIPGLEKVPVIALTAAISKGDKERALTAGCDGYIPKPIDVEKFPEQVTQYLTGKKEVVKKEEKDIYAKEYQSRLVDTLQARIEELEKKNRDLEESQRRLKEAQDSLVKSEKLKVLGEFVSGIVHEVKNPLVGIMGASELLTFDEKDEKKLKMLKIINEESERLSGLINSILSYAKKRDQIQLEEIDINSFLESKFPMWLSQLVRVNVNLKKDFTDSLPPIKADTQRLYQIFLNLVLNAREALAESKGGQITVITALRKEKGKEMVDIKFSDTGEGIKEENLKNIFLPLFTTKESGTGLGLSICKEMIEKMKGKIAVESELGKGTTFTISFVGESAKNKEKVDSKL